MSETVVRVHIWVKGRVQGVGFRAFVASSAGFIGVHGWVRNVGWDTVEALAEGSREKVDQFIQAVKTGPRASRVDDSRVEEEPPPVNFPALKCVHPGKTGFVESSPMTHIWRYLLTLPARGAWNMAVDEAILETAGRGESLPTLRLYDWAPACLSLGYAQSYKDVDVERLKSNGWDVVRRATGGRAILHVDELTYSVTAPPDEPRVLGSVLESYYRLAGALTSAVRALGLPVEMEENAAPSSAAKGPVCFEVPSAYEIVVHGKKLIGSAQARKKEGVLQHGTFPLYGDLTRITQALVFPDEQARTAAAQKLLARATTAETVLGRRIAWGDAAQAFVHAFETELDMKLEPGELTPAEHARAEELLQKKYDHPAWTERS